MFMFKDIEQLLTQKAAQYIANGYIVNATTMAGHQGEVCKLDLRKGDEVVRILIDRTNNGRQTIYYLLVGKNTDPLYGGVDDIIWNKNLQEIERYDFYVISDRYPEKIILGTVEEAKAALDKRLDRDALNPRYNDYITELSDEYKKAAYHIVRKKEGFESIKMADITKVCCEVRRNRVKRVVAYISKKGRKYSVTLREVSL